MKTIRSSLINSLFALTALLLAWASNSALAQSAADNIRPVGQVCLQGQACVGQAAAGSGSVAATPSAPEPAAAPAPQPPAAENEPVAAEQTAAAASDFDVEATYNRSCMACHTTGAAGAPMLGDSEAWTERLEKGMDAVMANAISGVGAMPARGLCMDCSDDNLRALIDYMINQ